MPYNTDWTSIRFYYATDLLYTINDNIKFGVNNAFIVLNHDIISGGSFIDHLSVYQREDNEVFALDRSDIQEYSNGILSFYINQSSDEENSGFLAKSWDKLYLPEKTRFWRRSA